MSQTELVFAETSPYGSLELLVEQDDAVACMYLRPVEARPEAMKSCWIRNLQEADPEWDRERLSSGLAPRLPAGFCRQVQAAPRLDEKRLRVVWFESGDGAALLEDDRVVAVIPPFIESQPFDGLSIECSQPSPLVGPLTTENQKLHESIAAADRFWKSWQTESSPWDQYEPQLLNAYESCFGRAVGYYSIDGDQWPPRALARFEWDGKVILLTVGVSICPQPRVDSVFPDPGIHRRFELGAVFSEEASKLLTDSFAKYLSGQVRMPWQQQTFLAHGHSVTCDLFLKSSELPDFSSILLFRDSASSTAQRPVMPEVFGDPVNLLWSVPLFENERKFVQETGNFSLVQELVRQDSLPMIRQRATAI